MRNSFLKKFLEPFFLSLFVIFVVFLPSNSHAVYEGVRDGISYSTSDNRCDTGKLSYNPFMNNRDITWEPTNTTCASFMASFGAVIFAIDTAASYSCASTAQNYSATTAPLSPLTLAKSTQLTWRCGVYASSGNPAATACCTSAAAYYAAIGAALTGLAIIYKIADYTYQHATICGKGWYEWGKDSDGNWVEDKGTYQDCLKYLFATSDEDSYNSSSCSSVLGESYGTGKNTITNKLYREYLYGGMEVEDSANGNCTNPSGWDSAKRLSMLGYDGDNQRYYMTGASHTPVYACHRFLTSDTTAQDAYACCKRRSQNAICIENRFDIEGPKGDTKSLFCEIGSKCDIAGIVFEVYESEDVASYVCAKTYSVCPYNHPLGGGTELDEYSSSTGTASYMKNFCQYMNHCSKIPTVPYVRTTDLDGGFISSACYDWRGDSQNVYTYNSQLVNVRGFSSPIVQCFKETMENIFLHKAGHTICQDPDEYADSDGVCASGDYFVEEGDDLPGDSFFTQIQDNLQDIIKIGLVMSITLFGIMTLIASGGQIQRKQISMLIVKIGLVMYFAVGDAWHSVFMKGVLGMSGYLANMTFITDSGYSDRWYDTSTKKTVSVYEDSYSEKLDGCQFPRYNYADSDEDTRYDNPSYPTNEDYLGIWDTLDCKIARALGFGPNVSVPNIIGMIFGGFLTGGLGIVFVVGSFFFAFCLISVTIRAMHIFLLSITSVVILLYVSPITITLAMFSKTKSIFDAWWKQLLGFTLQPMILFAYLGVFITVFDSTIIGDVTFSGDGKTNQKEIVCSGEVKNTSLYCIFNLSEMKTFHGLETLGIGLPMLTSMNATKLQSITKAAIIMFVLMSFLDKITSFAATLVGGAELASDWKVSASEMAGKSFGALKGIQQRGMRGFMKHGKTAARGAMDKVSDVGKILGERKGAGSSESSGSDSVSKSKPK